MRILIYFMAFALIFLICVLVINHRSIKMRIARNKLRKEIRGNNSKIYRMKSDFNKLLIQHNVSYKLFALMIAGSAVFGYLFGKVLYTRTGIAVVFGLATALLPFVYLFLTSSKQERTKMEKLEASMLCITSSYMVEKDLNKVVRENINNLEYSKPFIGFLTETSFINSNVEQALVKMKQKENSMYFSQWVDILIQAQYDHKSVPLAMVVIKQMNAVRRMHEEADAKMFSDWKDYFTGLFVCCCIPLAMRIIMHDWYSMLISTPIGIILVLLFIVSLVFSVSKALKTGETVTAGG